MRHRSAGAPRVFGILLVLWAVLMAVFVAVALANGGGWTPFIAAPAVALALGVLLLRRGRHRP
ncbi:hypothetical protein [Streptomyces sp. NPDC046887]|uniref:hypothetical protein n=1 Tax=Streptomyces sp. NPDC046887 TaxID=3155472 RepID=UPI00340F7C5D